MHQLNNITALLGINAKIKNDIDLVNITRKGIRIKAIENLANHLHINTGKLSAYLPVSQRTLKRYEKKNDILSKIITDRLLQIAEVLATAIDVFEDEDNASTWMTRKNKALGDMIPLELMDTSAGINLVLDILGRIEYGVYS